MAISSGQVSFKFLTSESGYLPPYPFPRTPVQRLSKNPLVLISYTGIPFVAVLAVYTTLGETTDAINRRVIVVMEKIDKYCLPLINFSPIIELDIIFKISCFWLKTLTSIFCFLYVRKVQTFGSFCRCMP